MHRPSTSYTAFLLELNQEYEQLHTAKEDAFWALYMGLTEDPDAAQKAFNGHELKLQNWLHSPQRLKLVREELERARSHQSADIEKPHPDDLLALEGWHRTLQTHCIESEEARDLFEEILACEGKLSRSRAEMNLGYEENGEFIAASSVKLGTMLRTEKNAARRKAAWQGLRSIEGHVLKSGYLDVVRMRNRLGKMLGGEDFYDWQVRRSEGMTKREIFDLLDELEAKTREAGRRCIAELKQKEGAENVTPWNTSYLVSGDITNEQSPYFPFAKSFLQWGRTFAALGITYAGAHLVLDLLDRKGKHENGFMHGPVPAWRDRGAFRPARIQFTANAIPGMPGSGRRAIETFFHEGGHAAHFANIDMPAPCFAQEFAPTSVAFAEVQSMLLDSLVGDADWQTRYALNSVGESMPWELMQRAIEANQPFAAWSLRSMLVVPYAERAIYELPENQLTAENVLKAIREVESRLLGLAEGSPRPVLSVPHLISAESSAYYHGYILAEMGVYQTRDYLIERDGYLLDNPKLGPDLREHYWQPGNSRRFPEFIGDFTKTPLSAEPLARRVNRSVEEALAEAQGSIEKLADIPRFEGEVDLDAVIDVMHGNHRVTGTLDRSFESAAADFSQWIEEEEGASG